MSTTLSNAGEYNPLQSWWVQPSPTLVSTTLSNAGEYNHFQRCWVQPSPMLVSTTLTNAGRYCNTLISQLRAFKWPQFVKTTWRLKTPLFVKKTIHKPITSSLCIYCHNSPRRGPDNSPQVRPDNSPQGRPDNSLRDLPGNSPRERRDNSPRYRIPNFELTLNLLILLTSEFFLQLISRISTYCIEAVVLYSRLVSVPIFLMEFYKMTQTMYLKSFWLFTV